MNAAAVILCAGKGTRMNDDSKNKVCFDCAGVPVIRRIIGNMRAGGVSRFVIVIGHQAYSVMDTLDGEDGVIYAYQKEQKGTGHAALCGLRALETLGYTGPVIVSMGDKIIAAHVISELLERAGSAKAVWGVQPLSANFSGGRVVVRDGVPCGVVEFADAAWMALADTKPERYEEKLKTIGLNAKKAAKVMKAAAEKAPVGTKTICGRTWTADEILHTPYANAGLYCFDTKAAAEALGNVGSDNAQGEIYLTDTLELFAAENEAVLYEVKSAGDMLTYSTKPELAEMSRHFLRTASRLLADIRDGKEDETFRTLYPDSTEQQKQRYAALLEDFIRAYGDKKVIIARSPGRINLMGRHIDHRGGGINVMATDKDTVLVCSPRNDDTVRIRNLDPVYPERSFSVSECLSLAPYENWLDYLNAEPVVNALRESGGDWSNYVKSAVLRAQTETEYPLCGMDIAVHGTIPAAAGLSSSSSIVVAVTEAVNALNGLNLDEKTFIDLCGTGEWFVGSRGGSGDQAAMKCGKRDTIVHLNFKPFGVGERASFSDKYAVLVANSMIKAKKSEGSKDKFNAKVAAYEVSFLLLKKAFPEYDLHEFRDLAELRPVSRIYEMLKALPETASRTELRSLLPEAGDFLERTFASHADPGGYDLRGVTLYGISECVRSKSCMDALNGNDYARLGEMMKVSHNGDRLTGLRVTDDYLDGCIRNNADIALEYGAYGCSTEQIDGLCDLLNGTPGVLGSELVGAGLGGCVIALVEKEKADSVISVLNQKYYDEYGYEHAANVYSASCGSSVMY